MYAKLQKLKVLSAVILTWSIHIFDSTDLEDEFQHSNPTDTQVLYWNSYVSTLVIPKKVVIQIQECSRSCHLQNFTAQEKSLRPEKFPSDVGHTQWRQKLKEIRTDACSWSKLEKG